MDGSKAEQIFLWFLLYFVSDTDVAEKLTPKSGREVFMYDVATMVSRGVHNIQFAHEKDPGNTMVAKHTKLH